MAGWPLEKAETRQGILFNIERRDSARMGITLTPLDPIKALYWSAVINGVVAVPVMSVMMVITAQRKIMKKFVIVGWLRWLGWTSTAAMAVSVVGMVVGWLS